jgi:hypothetical protein
MLDDRQNFVDAFEVMTFALRLEGKFQGEEAQAK